MPYVQVRGVDHYYEWIGETNQVPDLTKPVLVFVHGWAGSGRYWRSTAEALRSEFNCLLYDWRGFGRSLLPRPIPSSVEALGYELEGYAEDLAQLLDGLGIQKVIINAHSAGASIATYFLNLYPEKVDCAILTCNGIFEYDEKAFAAFYQFGGYVVKFRPLWLAKIPFANRIFMARFLYRSLPDADSQAFLEDFLMADYEAAIGTIYTCVSKKAVEVMPKEFARLQVPTLMISGQYDQIIPAEMGRQAAALNEKIEFVVIPNTAHFPMLEDAKTYLHHLREFLQVNTSSIRVV
jgi:pimeloyl-ACP methyl ester carboxylesterase